MLLIESNIINFDDETLVNILKMYIEKNNIIKNIQNTNNDIEKIKNKYKELTEECNTIIEKNYILSGKKLDKLLYNSKKMHPYTKEVYKLENKIRLFLDDLKNIKDKEDVIIKKQLKKKNIINRLFKKNNIDKLNDEKEESLEDNLKLIDSLSKSINKLKKERSLNDKKFKDKKISIDEYNYNNKYINDLISKKLIKIDEINEELKIYSKIKELIDNLLKINMNLSKNEIASRIRNDNIYIQKLKNNINSGLVKYLEKEYDYEIMPKIQKKDEFIIHGKIINMNKINNDSKSNVKKYVNQKDYKKVV